MSRTPAPLSLARRWMLACCALAGMLLDAGIAQAATAADSAVADTSLARALVQAGFENVAAERSEGQLRVALENRRYRYSATAFGIASRLAAEPSVLFERRLGLVAAAAVYDTGGEGRAAVYYPSDGSYPAAPREPKLASTQKSLDLVIRPLFTYELGRLFDPVQVRLEIMPELRYNPWPGGRIRAGLVFPIRNDFDTDSLHPDLNRIRPGPVLLEQFAWAPGAALVSGTAGLLGNNRYGLSVGVARPLSGGRFLVDGQMDITGFVAFTDSGTTASTPSLWTGFAGVTYRPRVLDLAIRARVARFLYGDKGVELELKRSMGDLDVAFYVQRTQDVDPFTVTGVRVAVPIPPATRPVGPPVRVLPVERFSLSYADEAAPVGRYVGEVASREDYLRQLNPPSLADKADRFRGAVQPKTDTHPTWGRASMSGMTGFVNTPWCGTIGDRDLEVGYNTIPKAVAYDHRGQFRNDVYYAALGFMPHFEAGLRWTVIPGLKSFGELVPNSKLTDSDRMLSARVELVAPRVNRPGLAIGIEDARGTRRFHSTYVVTGIPMDIYQLQNRMSLGYAPHIFTASRHVLDGLFGAVEVLPWRFVALALENDTQKWNGLAGFEVGLGLRVRVALLDLERADSKRVSLGAGWSHSL
ncbi:MAG: YjbH domain-containing protein [Candidatus Eisenbacteria bacterium]|uniref:YjbH domain-containing protein n=1 Tax=Eiseniibacteriota bacterium TaxID=2212470 RepID=A0A538TKY7_UNCEI|nr:MAG: YjbH domain-containing protein [Candidatus Eisenbacteria bacterium]